MYVTLTVFWLLCYNLYLWWGKESSLSSFHFSSLSGERIKFGHDQNAIKECTPFPFLTANMLWIVIHTWHTYSHSPHLPLPVCHVWMWNTLAIFRLLLQLPHIKFCMCSGTTFVWSFMPHYVSHLHTNAGGEGVSLPLLSIVGSTHFTT